MSEKLSYTPMEFARLMGVGYTTVRNWLAKGRVPGAYLQGDGHITIRRWRIPHEALQMNRVKRGSPKGTKYRSKKDRIVELKAELDDLNKRHMALIENHAKLQGRYDQLHKEFEHAKGFARLQENHLDDSEKQIEDLKDELELAEAHIKTLQGSLEAESANVEMLTKRNIKLQAELSTEAN